MAQTPVVGSGCNSSGDHYLSNLLVCSCRGTKMVPGFGCFEKLCPIFFFFSFPKASRAAVCVFSESQGTGPSGEVKE